MHPTTTHVALRALAHPLTLGWAGVLALNALWWQPAFPSWWTGKIGGVAWLAVAPLLVALALGVVGERLGGWGAGRQRTPPARLLLLVALALTGAAFGLVKTVPAINAAVVAAFAAGGVHAKLALDPADLLALPGLGLAALAWRASERPARERERFQRATRLAAVLVAAGALAADSAAPVPYGVVCVGQGGFTLYAVQEWSATGYFGAQARQEVYTSSDGGLTWAFSESDQYDPDEGRGLRHWCAEPAWPLTDPQDAARAYWYVSGSGLYVTTDGGQTLTLEQAAPAILGAAPSAVFDQATNNLVVAAGLDGVYVRTEAGWAGVAVGE